MKERELAFRLKHYLNRAADRLDPATANKLFIARQNALARQKIASAQAGLAALGRISVDIPLPNLRTVIALIALAVGVAGATVWNDFQRAAEYAEIDSALLADDLPINAYLDRGFQAWLEQHSSQQ